MRYVEVAELVYAYASGAYGFTALRVQVPPSTQILIKKGRDDSRPSAHYLRAIIYPSTSASKIGTLTRSGLFSRCTPSSFAVAIATSPLPNENSAPIFAASSTTPPSGNATTDTNKDTVKPIPATIPTTSKSRFVIPCGISKLKIAIATMVHKNIPSGFPTSNEPRTKPVGAATLENTTPAFTSANNPRIPSTSGIKHTIGTSPSAGCSPPASKASQLHTPGPIKYGKNDLTEHTLNSNPIHIASSNSNPHEYQSPPPCEYPSARIAKPPASSAIAINNRNGIAT